MCVMVWEGIGERVIREGCVCVGVWVSAPLRLCRHAPEVSIEGRGVSRGGGGEFGEEGAGRELRHHLNQWKNERECG